MFGYKTKIKEEIYTGNIEHIELLIENVYNSCLLLKKDLSKDSVRNVIIKTLNVEKQLKEKEEKLIINAFCEEQVNYYKFIYGDLLNEQEIKHLLWWCEINDKHLDFFKRKQVYSKHIIKNINNKYIIENKLIILADKPLMIDLNRKYIYTKIYKDTDEKAYVNMWDIDHGYYIIHLPKE